MSKQERHPLIWSAIAFLGAATVITLIQFDTRREPRWLEEMNNLEHFVFHLTLVLAGLIVGASGVTVLLYCRLRMRNPRRRRGVLARALNEERPTRLTQANLIAIAVFALATVAVILAKRHIIEPLWLTHVTPFEHLLVHVGLVRAGLILGASCLGVFAWSLLKLPARLPTATRVGRPNNESRSSLSH